jgi:hypothetical protein
VLYYPGDLAGKNPLFIRKHLHGYVFIKGGTKMGNYDLDDLITRWELEKLTSEQAVGQILLALRALSQRVRELERRWWRQEQANNATR